MFAPPDPKKVAFKRREHEAEERKQNEVATCYRQHFTGQARYERWERDELRAFIAAASLVAA